MTNNARLQLHFDFAYHHLKADGKNLGRDLAAGRPHVYIMEDMCTLAKKPARGETFAEDVRNINGLIDGIRKGTLKPEELEQIATPPGSRRVNEFKLFELQMIVRVPKLLLFYLENHGLGEEMLRKRSIDDLEHNIAYAELFKLHVQNAIAHYKTTFSRPAECYRIREVNIAENLATLQDDLFEMFPQLKGAPKVRVFIRYGSSHYPIADSPTGADKVSVSYEPGEHPLASEIIRRHMRGETADIGDELYLRGLIEETLIEANLYVAREHCQSNQKGVEPSMGDCTRKAKELMLHRTEGELLRCFDGMVGKPKYGLLLSRVLNLPPVSSG